MSRWLVRALLVVLLITAGWFCWRVFFPGPERVIRKRLLELAKVASFGPNESPLAQVANAANLTSFFTEDVEITIELRGDPRRTFNGRPTLLTAAQGARLALGSLQVEFVDIQVAVDPGKTSATVTLTAKGKVKGDLQVQELKLVLKKIDGDWLISNVETVKTLSLQREPSWTLLPKTV